MLRNITLAACLAVVAIVSGCAIHHPQNAEEFRKALPGATFGQKESFTVKRNFKAVAKTFQKMAPKCLHKRVKSTSSGYMHYQVVVTDYNPTVHVTKDRVELHLQQDHVQGVMHVSKKPKGGYYLMVVDATPISKKETRIEMYAPSVGHDHIIKAIKGWATGNNIGCPDLTK